MQANPRPPARKAPKFLDAKILIAALSAAVTVGFWNLFAGQSLASGAAEDPSAQLQDPEEQEALRLQVEDPREAGLPPVPTLVPMLDLSSAPVNGANPAAAQGGPSAPLRSVAAPTVVVVQKNRPMIDSPSVTVVGGRGGGGSRPAATTRSSR